jgi:hypothetical protein
MPASTTPIYPNSVIHWRTKLVGEVSPRAIANTFPIKLGTAGINGAIIHSISATPLGNNTASLLRLYSQKANGNAYELEIETNLPAITTASETAALTPVVVDLPLLLPNTNKGLHLEPGETLYAALSVAVAAGINVFVRGGNY